MGRIGGSMNRFVKTQDHCPAVPGSIEYWSRDMTGVGARISRVGMRIEFDDNSVAPKMRSSFLIHAHVFHAYSEWCHWKIIRKSP